MNGAGLTPGSVARSGASGGGRIMGAEAGVHNKLAEIFIKELQLVYPRISRMADMSSDVFMAIVFFTFRK